LRNIEVSKNVPVNIAQISIGSTQINHAMTAIGDNTAKQIHLRAIARAAIPKIKSNISK
jgi:hypothetical protein